MIGGAEFPGGTAYADWPLEPIALHRGVPILIAMGYILGGCPEPSAQYLAHALETCTWRAARYEEKDAAALRAAVADFIATSKWKRPLADLEKSFLLDQAGD